MGGAFYQVLVNPNTAHAASSLKRLGGVADYRRAHRGGSGGAQCPADGWGFDRLIRTTDRETKHPLSDPDPTPERASLIEMQTRQP